MQFNVFDVMHHGTHEKQLSNVFGWLLDTQGTHHLEDRFLRIFIEEVNRDLPESGQFAATDYLVLQEVNTALGTGQAPDISDLVLMNDEAVIVVENYYTSDGHGHNYAGYLSHSRRDGRQGAVVLLCEDYDSARQTQGWEEASVVTYGKLLRSSLAVGQQRPSVSTKASRTLFIHRPDVPQVRQGEWPHGRSAGA
ncbi:MAG: PD-(D/E)XK nuclease family protein [Candidatus Nanopelagicales bacterium]